MTTQEDERGVLHRHADGREHRHFRAGFEIGGQVIEDQDGTEEHSHGTMTIGGGGAIRNESGPVVWTELDSAAATLAEHDAELPSTVAGRAALREALPDDPFEGLAPPASGPRERYTPSERQDIRDAGRGHLLGGY